MSSSSNSGGVAIALFAAGPVTGLAIYHGIQAKYRNRAARYMPERVVAYKATNVESKDAFVRSIVTSASSVPGRNDTTPAVRARYTDSTKD